MYKVQFVCFGCIRHLSHFLLTQIMNQIAAINKNPRMRVSMCFDNSFSIVYLGKNNRAYRMAIDGNQACV